MRVFLNCILFYFSFNIRVEVQAIIGRSTASAGDLPFQVSVQVNDKHNCGGTILNQEFIITARHCVDGKATENMRIVAGAINLKTMEHASIHQITRTFAHRPTRPAADDLALVQVHPRFDFGGFRSRAALPVDNFVLRKDQKVSIAGWGMKDVVRSKRKASTNLKIADVYALEQCNPPYVGEFCTVHKNLIKNRGVCKGDSGGPVALNKTVLVGVIAGSGNDDLCKPGRITCGSKDSPDRHTKVAQYLNWIRGIVDEHSNYPLLYQ